MSTPSLLNIPYRVKGGVSSGLLYSQIPETGAGDFTVTRATTPTAGQSTRINSQGLIELVPNHVARLDYPLGGAVNGCPALLVEPSAQNLALQSADFNTTWQSINSATVNTNTAISPDGTQNADTINLAAVSNSRVRQSITLANSTTYTISCFYKNIALTAGETFRMRFDNGASSPNNFVAAALIDLALGTATYTLTGTSGTGFSGTATGRVDNYGNGWYRVLLTFTVGSAGGGLGSFEVGYVNTATARSFYAWGAQLEASSVPTSYIPTTTAAVTRSAEQIRRANVSSLIGQTEGTIYLEVEAPTANNDVVVIQRQTLGTSLTSGDYIMLQKISTNLYRFIVVVGGSISFSITQSAPPTTSFVKIAMAYRGSSPASSAFFINGTQVGSDNTTTFSFPPSIQNIEFIGNQLVGAQTIRLRAFGIYPTRIPNTAGAGVLSLATLTAP